MNDDHGDQFAGAVPARTVTSAPRPDAAQQRFVRMRAAYVEKVNAAVQADREGLAYELAEQTFAEEAGGPQADGTTQSMRRTRRTAGRHSPTRAPGIRPHTTLSRVGRITRRSLSRFDRYTLDVFNPGHPYRSSAERADHQA